MLDRGLSRAREERLGCRWLLLLLLTVVLESSILRDSLVSFSFLLRGPFVHLRLMPGLDGVRVIALGGDSYLRREFEERLPKLK